MCTFVACTDIQTYFVVYHPGTIALWNNCLQQLYNCSNNAILAGKMLFVTQMHCPIGRFLGKVYSLKRNRTNPGYSRYFGDRQFKNLPRDITLCICTYEPVSASNAKFTIRTTFLEQRVACIGN